MAALLPRAVHRCARARAAAPRWLVAFPARAGAGGSAAAARRSPHHRAVPIIGPRRTRLVAQIAAAVIGAGFVIGLQLAAIASYGTLSRLAVLASEPFVRHAPAVDSAIWWPARAVLGDAPPLAALIAASALLLAAADRDRGAALCRLHHRGRGRVSTTTPRGARSLARFRDPLADGDAARKEWRCCGATLAGVADADAAALSAAAGLPAVAQLRRRSGARILLVPVLVMAAGQLRRRPRLARDLRRGCARPGRDRAAHRRAGRCAPRSKR